MTLSLSSPLLLHRGWTEKSW